MMAAEQAALEQGEKLINAQEEDRARKFERLMLRVKMYLSSMVSSNPKMTF